MAIFDILFIVTAFLILLLLILFIILLQQQPSRINAERVRADVRKIKQQIEEPEE